jgi:hypothetical protein
MFQAIALETLVAVVQLDVADRGAASACLDAGMDDAVGDPEAAPGSGRSGCYP